MPIQLTNPKNTGDLDPTFAVDGKYTQAKIIGFFVNLKNKRMSVELEYGNAVDGVWTPGILPSQTFTIQDEPEMVTAYDEEGNPSEVIPPVTDYSDMFSSPPTSLESSVYDQVASLLYSWLIDKKGISGTIV